ncbi:MAG: TonB-dependent receptor [Alphaproteobacteria bacterium]|nr:MAG: TonB-dependent receptor [Alphaproteobacteria bacterium]
MFPSFLSRTAVSALALSAALTVPVIAQEITARMGGSVAGPDGQAISGATVRVVHTPSGTSKTVTSNAAGGFSLSGLRVGGPYTVSVSAAGYQSLVVSDVYLDLDRPFDLNATLAAAGDVDEITVTAQQLGAGGIATGPSSTYGARDIALAPSIGRDLKDTIRKDPLVYIDPTNSDAVSVAGSNNRYNSFTVDGVKVNDDFGLNNGGYPTQRSPVSIDMVEQVSVLSSPFSVEYGGFKGATLNAVTKSGTNDFHGSLYYYKRDEEYTGETAKGAGLDTFEEKVYGGVISGPIIKDKLFFSLGYDFFEGTEPSEYGPAGSGKANEIGNVSLADVNDIISISQSVYGFDPGGYDIADLVEEDEKIFAKLDWNISDMHRASFSYQFNEGNEINPQNTFGSSNLGLSSNWYVKTEKLDVYTGHLYSDWTDNFSTEIKIAKKDVITAQDPTKGTDFAWMEIITSDGGTVHIGPDRFRHANALQNTTWQFKVKGIYTMGDHNLAFGWEREALEVFNLFVPNSAGHYEFASIADFQNGIVDAFEYTNAYTNDANDGAAEFDYLTDALFIMDTWDISDNLTVEAGVRYERYEAADRPDFNANFMATYGFANNHTIDGMDIFMPRVGFNYAMGNPFNMDRIHDVVLRGGVGLFSGGNPNVWISNTYTNDGVTVVNYPGGCGTLNDTLDPVNPGFDLPACVTGAMAAGDGNVDLLDPNFEIPSQWKMSLGLDFAADLGEWLGSDWNFTFDALFTDERDPINWQDLSMVQIGTVFDGRPEYSNLSGQDIMLTNGSGGGGAVYTFSVDKSWESGWDLYVSYAHQDIEDLNPGTSSTSTSNLGKFATTDPNNPSVATSNYEREHRVTMNLSYERAFFGDYLTNVTLFGEYRTGQPFSYTFDEGFNFLGDSQYSRDRHLLYVPTDAADPNVVWSGDALDLMDYVNSSELKKYKGKIAPRNAFESPDYTRFDLKFSQELPGIRPQDRTIFMVNIENIGNMLNDEWGLYEYDTFHYVVPLVDVWYDGTQYHYTDFNQNAVKGNHPNFSTALGASVWKVQFGIKYEF